MLQMNELRNPHQPALNFPTTCSTVFQKAKPCDHGKLSPNGDTLYVTRNFRNGESLRAAARNASIARSGARIAAGFGLELIDPGEQFRHREVQLGRDSVVEIDTHQQPHQVG